MYISKEIQAIREILNLSQEELSKRIDVSFKTINRWETGVEEASLESVERIYTFAYENKIYLNQIFEEILLDEYQIKNKIVLFHGTKSKLDLPLDLSHSKTNNDFGIGFYLGTNFKQASMYIANSNSSSIYDFCLNLEGLNKIELDVSTEWMLSIAYFRGWLNQYSNSKLIKEIASKVNNSDIVIAPIADNRMFDIISEFARGEISDEQCKHALAATSLGKQYVIRSEKALSRLSLIRISFLSKIEKNYYVMQKLEETLNGINKARISRKEYRNKGLYVDELLK